MHYYNFFGGGGKYLLLMLLHYFQTECLVSVACSCHNVADRAEENSWLKRNSIPNDIIHPATTVGYSPKRKNKTRGSLTDDNCST